MSTDTVNVSSETPDDTGSPPTPPQENVAPSPTETVVGSGVPQVTVAQSIRGQWINCDGKPNAGDLKKGMTVMVQFESLELLYQGRIRTVYSESGTYYVEFKEAPPLKDGLQRNRLVQLSQIVKRFDPKDNGPEEITVPDAEATLNAVVKLGRTDTKVPSSKS